MTCKKSKYYNLKHNKRINYDKDNKRKYFHNWLPNYS